MEAARIGAARSEVLSDAFDRPQVGGSIIETKFSSYATHENPYLYWGAVVVSSQIAKETPTDPERSGV